MTVNGIEEGKQVSSMKLNSPLTLGDVPLVQSTPQRQRNILESGAEGDVSILLFETVYWDD